MTNKITKYVFFLLIWKVFDLNCNNTALFERSHKKILQLLSQFTIKLDFVIPKKLNVLMQLKGRAMASRATSKCRVIIIRVMIPKTDNFKHTGQNDLIF